MVCFSANFEFIKSNGTLTLRFIAQKSIRCPDYPSNYS
jgi:hypothetical protein